MTEFRTRLPPPNSLVAFEAAARCQNFTRAARELNVTQAAVSRQIANLERFLGLPVFTRGHGRAQLTPEGRRLFDVSVKGLEQIAGVVAALRRADKKIYLTVASTISFAGLFLIPRIAGFRDAFPDIDLRFVSSDGDFDLAAENIDLAIKYGDGKWPGLVPLPLLRPEIFPVCSPSLLASGGQLCTLADLDAHTLLDRDEAGTFGIGWATWLKAVHGEPARIGRRVLFNSYDLLIRAAVEGQGVALGWKPLVDELLKHKALVRPINRRFVPKQSYYLVLPRNAPVNPHRETFIAWLKRAVAAG